MERSEHKLRIADYSEYPGPRYFEQGESSGEEFYHSILNEAFAKTYKNKFKLKIILDGTAGFASSFLDEAFGNLVFDFSLDIIKANIEIVSKQEPDWLSMIFNEVFADWEKRREENTLPKKTKNHPEWYRLVNNKLIKKVWL